MSFANSHHFSLLSLISFPLTNSILIFPILKRKSFIFPISISVEFLIKSAILLISSDFSKLNCWWASVSVWIYSLYFLISSHSWPNSIICSFTDSVSILSNSSSSFDISFQTAFKSVSANFFIFINLFFSLFILFIFFVTSASASSNTFFITSLSVSFPKNPINPTFSRTSLTLSFIYSYPSNISSNSAIISSIEFVNLSSSFFLYSSAISFCFTSSFLIVSSICSISLSFSSLLFSYSSYSFLACLTSFSTNSFIASNVCFFIDNFPMLNFKSLISFFWEFIFCSISTSNGSLSSFISFSSSSYFFNTWFILSISLSILSTNICFVSSSFSFGLSASSSGSICSSFSSWLSASSSGSIVSSTSNVFSPISSSLGSVFFS